MFGRKKKDISVRIKLYAGLDKGLDLKDYDAAKGALVTVQDKTKLRNVLRNLGVKDISSNAYYLSGKRIGLGKKLKDGDDVTCLRPSGGG